MSRVECYIVGAKGVSFYGGYESFVQKLLQYHKYNKDIHYHVACKANGVGAMEVDKLEGASDIVDNCFTYCNADCHLIHINENIGSAQAIMYDIQALKLFCKHIEENQIQNPVVCILACRIGPFMKKYVKKIHKLGGKVYLNPDGWKDIIWLNQKTPRKYSVLTA